MRKSKNLFYYSVPHLIHIETTYACNSRCTFCYNPNRNATIDYNTLDKIVASVRRSQIPHVYLIGGEPSLLNISKLNEYINTLSEVSSVTIVTNGLKYLEGLSDKLACIGIPIHGDKKTHEGITHVKGGYKKVISSIKKYVKAGFDVRCIPVLMSINYNQIYQIIKLAKQLGMESVFVDRFESGGLGSKFHYLKPTLSQFRKALTQMIAARDDFKIPVGFGTAIPFCLDKRLLSENMWADCGVGVSFGAIAPNGDFRICNQSNRIYGNVLKEPIEKIWHKKDLDEFRNLKWVTEPCKSCPLLRQCVCGCKVDQSFCDRYCLDYAIRGKKKPIVPVSHLQFKIRKLVSKIPKEYRKFKPNKYTKLNTLHKEKYLITRYQTIVIDKPGVLLLKSILEGINNEFDLIKKFKNKIESKEIRKFVSKLIEVEALDLIKNHEANNK